ncbi:phage antirepressor [Clostridium sp. UBA1056]|uniref:phage antirepressor n=1 Tax=unclassified Clostridium TaxID=2614128 RepID=UPI0032173B9D
MNNIQIFKNEEFGQVRAITKDNEPWFVGKDVATALGYKDTSDSIKRHVDNEDKLTRRFTDSGQSREMTVINESGLYSLILGSKLPSAKKFKRWVTNDVLPSVRKHGMYATDELLDNLDLLIEVATKLKEERAARIEAEKKVAILKPKAEFYDDVAGSKDAIEMSEVAKVLAIKGMGRNNLFEFLREEKILQSNNIPYQQYVDREYFRVLEQKYITSKGETKINIKTLVFQKGVEYIRKLIKEEC